jgi:Txe/YoeB family toxin of Txe-Axe toxin-antitoxin module
MRVLRPSAVGFVNDKMEKEFDSLDEGNEIKKYIRRAMDDMKQNAFCGIPIPKRLIPKIYIQKYRINNLWKYDLPDGWRLVYSITTPNKVEILAIILEWFSHPEYERRFHY